MRVRCVLLERNSYQQWRAMLRPEQPNGPTGDPVLHLSDMKSNMGLQVNGIYDVDIKLVEVQER